MKKLIIVNGTIGVGKSTVSKLLLDQLQPSVYLDGDWCWNMNPFLVTEENKAMVVDNICHLLKAYLNNSGYEYILFCWVIPNEEIFEQILQPLQDCSFELYKITLVCSEQELTKRFAFDVEQGVRKAEGTKKSLAYLPLYNKMNTIKIDVTQLTAQQTSDKIKELIT